MDEFEAIYWRHAAALLRFARGLTGDRCAAQDLVSETFVRMLVKAPLIDIRTALAYLLEVARNIHLNNRRCERRRASGGGRNASEQVAAMGWTGRPESTGMGGRNHWNPHGGRIPCERWPEPS